MTSVNDSRRGDVASPGDTESIGARGIGGFVYPMRIIGTWGCILLAAVFLFRFGSYHFYYLFLLLLTLAYPHVSHVIYRRTRARNVEHTTLLIDAFVLGSTVYVTGFSLLPALTLTAIALGNGLGMNGPRHMALSALVAAFGMTVPMAFNGVNYHPQNVTEINFGCAVFLFVYFNIFAYTAYERTILLQSSRRELKQQKITIEIEKKRSDNLLLSLLPAAVAQEFDAHGIVRPQRYESVSVLAVDFANFSNAMRVLAADELLAELNHCFKAFDAITTRHGLENLRTLGDSYLAAGGLPVSNETHPLDAVRAAVEIRDFMQQFAISRKAHGRPFFEVRVAVNTGPVIAGVVETRKFSYDVWGGTVDDAIRIRRQLDVGQVGISGPTRQRVQGHFSCTLCGTVRSKDAGEVPIYTVDRNVATDVDHDAPSQA